MDIGLTAERVITVTTQSIVTRREGKVLFHGHRSYRRAGDNGDNAEHCHQERALSPGGYTGIWISVYQSLISILYSYIIYIPYWFHFHTYLQESILLRADNKQSYEHDAPAETSREAGR